MMVLMKAPQDREKRVDIVQLKRAFVCWGIPNLYGRKQANKEIHCYKYGLFLMK